MYNTNKGYNALPIYTMCAGSKNSYNILKTSNIIIKLNVLIIEWHC